MDGSTLHERFFAHLKTLVKIGGGAGLLTGLVVAGSLTGLIPVQLQSAETGQLAEDWPNLAREDKALTVRLSPVVNKPKPAYPAAEVVAGLTPTGIESVAATKPDRPPAVPPADATSSPMPVAVTVNNIGTWQSVPDHSTFPPTRLQPSATVNAQPSAVAPLQQTVTLPALAVTDAAGQQVPLRPQGSERGVVVVCLATDCPLSRGYMSDLTRLSATWNSLGIRFCGVMLDPATTQTELLTFRHQEHVRFPLAIDREQLITETLKPTHTPEVFVIAADGRVVYRGRIDGRFDRESEQQSFSQDFLTDALESVVYGRSIAVSRTAAIGRTVR